MQTTERGEKSVANPRKPREIAEITGAALVHPGRHRDRAQLPALPSVGEPYDRMTDSQKARWKDIAGEFPWLAVSDRRQLRLLCQLEDEQERRGEAFSISKQNMIRRIYNSFGRAPPR